MNIYSNGIIYFFNRDKYAKINQLITQYFNILKNINYVTIDANNKNNTNRIADEDRPGILSELQKSLDKIFEMLRKFDKTIRREDIDIYYKLKELRSIQLVETQKQILIRDIRNKKLIFFPIIIETIKKTFYVLKGNKIPLEGSILFNDLFDTNMISRLIFTESFSKDKAIAYGSQMKFLINNLESPANIPITNTEWNLITEGNYKDVAEHFTYILFFIISKQKDICENIESLEIIAAAGIDSFINL